MFCNFRFLPDINVFCHFRFLPAINMFCHFRFLPAINMFCHFWFLPDINMFCHFRFLPDIKMIPPARLTTMTASASQTIILPASTPYLSLRLPVIKSVRLLSRPYGWLLSSSISTIEFCRIR